MNETITSPGGTILLGQPAADYFAHPAAGRTDIMTCKESPAKFKAKLDAKERSAAFKADRAEEGGSDDD